MLGGFISLVVKKLAQRDSTKDMRNVSRESLDMKKQPNAKHIATEQRTSDEILQSLPNQKRWADAVFSRLRRIATLPDNARVLDIGAASGGFLVACHQLGYRGEGIEPWEEARLNAIELSEYLEIPIHIVDGVAESIPYSACTFDVVHASSVIEHVQDVEKSIAEIYRVLKPGGIFWFNAASSMCPMQTEIRGFPCSAGIPIL